MTLKDTFRLSRRELAAYRTRSRATIITIGLLFGVLLAILLIIQGLENVALKYAKDATNGMIYLTSSYADSQSEIIQERIQKFGGEITALTDEQRAEIGTPVPESTIIAKFSNLHNAYTYYIKNDAKELRYNPEDYQITELFSNQVNTYRYFRNKNKDLVRPISIVLIIISAFILAFTLAHLLASSTKTFVLYRSIDASKGQILLIYLVYLLELCLGAVIFAIILALALSGVATALAWNYLLEQFTITYPNAPQFWPMLIGINLQCFAVILCIFLAAPASFLLCLDQFSSKKVAQRLKGD